VVLVFLSNAARAVRHYGQRGEQLYALQDATIACTQAMLAAAALGLGSCWIGAFEPAAVQRLLRVPRGWLPVALLSLGYAAESPAAAPRRPLTQLVKWEQAVTGGGRS
jgi:nitroreductase